MRNDIQIFKGHDGFCQMVRRWVNIHMKEKFNKDICVDDFLFGTSMHHHYTVSLHNENNRLKDDEYAYAETLVKSLNEGHIVIEEIISELEKEE